MSKTEYTDILKRSMNYCARAERCTRDMIEKLASWDAPVEMTEEILEKLRQDKFLDDDRYSKAYVADKWRLDQWGRGKIRNGLFEKGFSDLMIQLALDTIDQDEYITGMQVLLSKKRETITSEPMIGQMKKLLSFGSSRGFEEDLIWQWLEREGLSFDNNDATDIVRE